MCSLMETNEVQISMCTIHTRMQVPQCQFGASLKANANSRPTARVEKCSPIIGRCLTLAQMTRISTTRKERKMFRIGAQCVCALVLCAYVAECPCFMVHNTAVSLHSLWIGTYVTTCTHVRARIDTHTREENC